MQNTRLYIDKLLKSSKIVIFINDDFNQAATTSTTTTTSTIKTMLTNSNKQPTNNRINSDLIDLLKVYKIKINKLLIQSIDNLPERELSKAYLNTLCKRNNKNQYPLVFVDGKYFGSYRELNKLHEEGHLFTRFCEAGIIDMNANPFQLKQQQPFYTSSFDNKKKSATTATTLAASDFDINAINAVQNTNKQQQHRFLKKVSSDLMMVNNQQQLLSTVNDINPYNDDDDEMIDDSLNSEFTLESSLNNKYSYCLNYIKANYNTIYRYNDVLNEQIQEVSPPSPTIPSRHGLTPPNVVLDTIKSRLYRANEAIQTKKYDVLNKKSVIL